HNSFWKPRPCVRAGKNIRELRLRCSQGMFRSKALELNTDAARDSYVSPMVFAGLQATLGDKDKAFSWLARADTERSSKLLDLKVDPDFDSLRGDPRFTELVRHIGLP
ncbi:MAG: hypothetical protein WBW14_01375, partial [Candidatus Acidiferrum sp.]